MTQLPASIRYNNTGAIWPGPFAKGWGASRKGVLNDGEGNQIAYFPTAVQGAAAHFALLSSPKHYFGHTIGDAIATWSGADNPKRKNGKVRLNAYLNAIERETDWDRHDYIDDSILGQPETAIPFAKAMAKHEAGAGKPYPMTDAQWREAYALYKAKANGEKVKIVKAGKPLTSMPWMDEAEKWLGEKEIAGRSDNPDIMAFYRDAGHSGIQHDETPWCAAFVSACLTRSKCRSLQTLVARDYEGYGPKLSEPEYGSIGVKWRGSPSSWQGHVGFVADWTATKIKLRGANQRNSVSEAWFPRREFVGFYMPQPKVKPIMAPEVIGHPSVQEKSVGIVGVLSALVVTLYNAGAAMWGQVATFFGMFASDLPNTAVQIQSTVGAGKSIAESSGLIWLSAIGLVIAGIYLTRSILRTVKRARVQDEEAPA